MTRSRWTRRSALAALVGTLGLALAASGADVAPAAPKEPAAAVDSAGADSATDDTADMDPEAVEVLQKMVKVLADSKSLHVRVDEEFDALQADGETLSFGKTSNMTLRRPDRIRVESAERSGRKRISTYDGKHVTVSIAEDNVYATVDRTGDLDDIVAFLRDDIGMKMPLAGLFSPELGPFLLENVTSATYVDEETLDGVNLDHIAFRYGDGIGIQLWVPTKGDAFPNRLVMTFEDARGRPQFRADFREWDRAPKITDAMFVFTPPKGVRRVPFVLQTEQQQPPAPDGEEGSR